ncbi:hypothetical protein HID58_005582 [Brassica napus]|uniref:Uncharacterized protein n=1 Tax=Brassica napus TaxID=3708 RepID=A0ABQ8EBW1_BRANA|nr:hypothetical protein HID58_005582 [Brassica napus]
MWYRFTGMSLWISDFINQPLTLPVRFGVLLLTSRFVSPTSCRSICVFDGFPSMIEEVPCGALFLLWNGSGLGKGFPVIPWVWMLFFDITQALTVLVGPLLKSFPRS